ncbi:hypothetical protein BK010_04800 [Tenericutes bacterium MO-XQ]|nr:hypothetical protein BK010_04800 [Tenericutes bacterium MO-XQ]
MENKTSHRKISVYHIALLLVLLTVFFRGPTFFRLFSTSFGAIRLNYILLLTAFILIVRRITRRESIIIILMIIGLLLNVFIVGIINFDYIVYVLQAFIYYFVLMNIVKSNKIKSYGLFKILSLMLFLIEILVLIEVLTGFLFFHINPPYIINNSYDYYRGYLFFYNSNNLSLFLISLYLLILFYKIQKSNYKLFMAIQTSILIVILILNDSNISLLALFFISAFIIFNRFTQIFRKKIHRSHFTRAILVFICLLIGIGILIELGFFRFILDNVYMSYQYDGRFQIYRDALNVFFNNPFGIGLGQSDLFFQTNVHFVVMQLIVELGVIGLLILFLYFYNILRILLSVKKGDLFSLMVNLYLLLLPFLSVQVSRILSDNALILIWAFFFTYSNYEYNKRFLALGGY